MTGRTHLTVGVLSGLLLTTSPTNIALIALGSILPDFDHPRGILGRYIPFFSKFVSHRGVTHSIAFAVLVGLINFYIAFGIAIHIVLDMTTKQGVKLLYPSDKCYRFPFAKNVVTGGKVEYFLLVLWVVVCAIIYCCRGKLS